MLDLDSPRWQEMEHAYGDASDIPALLRLLEVQTSLGQTNEDARQELWYSLWGALCHQSTVYPASYAAVPHIVRIAALAKDPPAVDFFCLPAKIEQGRDAGYDRERGMPSDLEGPYFASIGQLPLLIPRLALADWDEATAREIAACLVGMKGHSDLAALIEMTDPDEIEAYYEFRDKKSDE